ncbi:MAG TPA: S8 family serine peptidase [Longimicrobium sp.]|nr:S8 family serine peptidase [Longimicrobium sp.]
MKQAERGFSRARSVLLLAALAACADQPVTPRPTGDAAAPSLAREGKSPRDVPAVRIDLPAAPRAWDHDPAALAQAVSNGGGYAVVAFKEPGSARALATGNRSAVTAGTVRAGLELLERSGAEVVELLDAIGAARVRIPPQAAAELARHPLVDFVEPRQYGELLAQTTPWGITMVLGTPSFWSATGYTGAGAKVEIIDTGHQQNHVDLPAVPTASCAGAHGGCDDGSGASWHGTHVLGIVAARNNTDGVVGVAPGIANSDVYMYGACDSSSGSCPTDYVTAGINAGIWNVHVINLSLSQPYDAAQATAVAQAWSNGIVIVAAAGNNLSNTTIYPAAYNNVIGVSGVNSNKSFAASGTTGCSGYSNYGSHVDLAAPFSAYSTLGVNSYGTLCGTSMATPHVTGVTALLKSQNPSWTNQQIVDSLFARAEDLGTAGKDVYFGYGLVRPLRPPPTVYISGVSNVSVKGTYAFTANYSNVPNPTFTWYERSCSTVQGTLSCGAWSPPGVNIGQTYNRVLTPYDCPSGPITWELRVVVGGRSDGLTAQSDRSVNLCKGGIPIE